MRVSVYIYMAHEGKGGGVMIPLRYPPACVSHIFLLSMCKTKMYII